jgi:hypothetical protein
LVIADARRGREIVQAPLRRAWCPVSQQAGWNTRNYLQTQAQRQTRNIHEVLIFRHTAGGANGSAGTALF